MAKRVLVTGGTGLVGSHLVEVLRARGHAVTCLVRESSDVRWLEGSGADIVRVDFLGPREPLARAVDGHDVVYHVAGAIRAHDYRGFLLANVETTERLITACVTTRRRPQRFVLVSSVGAFGPPPLGERLSEQTPAHPATDYGRSKLAGEKCALRFLRELEVVIVRPTSLYGPRDREMLPLFRLAGLGLLPAFAGRGQIHNLCHVADIAEGIARAGEASLTSGEAFVLGAAEEHTMAEVAEVFGRVLARRTRLVPLPRALLVGACLVGELGARLTRQPAMLNRQKIGELVGSWPLDLSAARARLGYAPRIALQDGIAETHAWYRREGWL